jgi:hypothetical protein
MKITLVGLILLSLFGAPAKAAESGAARVPSNHQEKRVCAFENTKTGECVVDFVCRQKDPDLCDVIVKFLKTHEMAKVAPTTPPETNVACDNNPILCTCCSVHAGCYPCPKE